MNRCQVVNFFVDGCRNVDLLGDLSKVFCLCLVSDLACCLMASREVDVASTYVDNVFSENNFVNDLTKTVRWPSGPFT